MQNKTLLIVAIIAIALGAVIAFLGSLFKIMHWPGPMILFFGGIIIVFVAIILFVVYFVKSRENR